MYWGYSDFILIDCGAILLKLSEYFSNDWYHICAILFDLYSSSIYCIVSQLVKRIILNNIFKNYAFSFLRYMLFKVKLETHHIMAKVSECSLKISEFELKSCYYINFWTNTFGKGMNPHIYHRHHPAMG